MTIVYLGLRSFINLYRLDEWQHSDFKARYYES